MNSKWSLSSHEYRSSQEVARLSLSNERTFQTRHCGLWHEPPAHAVLTAKEQAKLFADSFLTTMAKMSPIPSSFCHPLDFLFTVYPDLLSLHCFSISFFFLSPSFECGQSAYYDTGERSDILFNFCSVRHSKFSQKLAVHLIIPCTLDYVHTSHVRRIQEHTEHGFLVFSFPQVCCYVVRDL